MDETTARYYKPPEHHNDDIRRMGVWLAAFFTTVTLLAGTVVYFADQLVHYLPFSAEQRFVRPYEAMAEYFQDDPTSPEAVRAREIERYLQTLADDLSVQLDLPDDYVVQVHYLDHDIVNAFATLGGHVFVFRGLLEELPDENSLAMVLAHEIAHIKHRDPAAALGRGLAIQMLYSYISGDYSRDLALQSGELGMLMFSREQENRADTAALEALQKHYGHVQGFDTLFAGQQESDAAITDHEDHGTNVDEWLSSHPSSSDRINRLRQLSTAEGWRLHGQVAPIPSRVRSLVDESGPK